MGAEHIRTLDMRARGLNSMSDVTITSAAQYDHLEYNGSAWVNTNDIALIDTTTNTTGIIFKGADRFIHNFHDPTGGGAVPAGENTFIGVNAGNFTMGSTATETYHGSYNTGIGKSAFNACTTGYNNTANGWSALNACTSGHNNTASGYSALYANTSGYYNTSNGRTALYANTSGHSNTASGVSALNANTEGYQNTANGINALGLNTTGHSNIASGASAGRYITGGSTANQTSNTSVYLGASTKASADGNANEIVIGYDTTGNGSNTVTIGNSSITGTYLTAGSLYLIDTDASADGVVYKGSDRFIHNFHHPTGDSAVPTGQNTFVGVDAGNFTVGSTATSAGHGSYNTAIGKSALYSCTTGYQNTASGRGALQSCTTGYQNTASGRSALESCTSGYNNTASGRGALYSCTTGYQNTASGVDALYACTTGHSNIASGVSAGRYITGGSTANQTSNTSVYLGANTKASADGNANEIVIGYDATGNGSNTVTIGNSSITGTYLTAGSLYLIDTDASADGVIYKGSDRFIHNFHHPTGDTAVPTGNNTFVGVDAGNFTMGSTATNTSHGSYNTATGKGALNSCTTGYNNTANGVSALNSNTTGHTNTANGANVLYSNTAGYNNTANGVSALNSNTTGHTNTANGVNAGRYITGGSTANQTSNTSVYFGASTKASADGNSNEIVIGYDATGNGSNTVTIGNSSITDNVFTAGQLSTAGGRKVNITTVAAATYDLLATDHILHVTYTGTGAVTSLTLPTAQVVAGRIITIHDAGGNANTNNITIDTEGAETINGAATLVIDADYGTATIYSDGSNWFYLGIPA